MNSNTSSFSMSEDSIENGGNSTQRFSHLSEQNNEPFETNCIETMDHPTEPTSNQIRNEYRCAKCQSTRFNSTNSSNQFDKCSTCDYHDQTSIHSNDYKKTSNPSETAIPICSPSSQIKIISEQVKSIAGEISTLTENVRILQKNKTVIQNSLRHLSEQWSALQNDFEQQTNAINIFVPNYDLLAQRLTDLHYATYDGSLTWIIDDWGKKIHDAQTGQIRSIYSPVFYSSGSGYKMRVRLDPYGYGDARDTHMSIFLLLLKGDFDPILTWPFNYPINFCLFDQTGDEHHIVDSFNPDSRSVSFQRPITNQNIPSGILKFCPLEALLHDKQRYIRQNKMIIKIKVDFFGTPRSILAQTSAINPGLTIPDQDAICYRMIQQHKQAEAKLIAAINMASQEVTYCSIISPSQIIERMKQQSTTTFTVNSDGVTCEELIRK